MNRDKDSEPHRLPPWRSVKIKTERCEISLSVEYGDAMSIVWSADVFAVSHFSDSWPDLMKRLVIVPEAWRIEGRPVVLHVLHAQVPEQVIFYSDALGISPADSYETIPLDSQRINWQAFTDDESETPWLRVVGMALREVFAAGLIPFWRPHIKG